jgi:hypothetical protein
MGSLSIIHWVILILLVALPVGLFLWLRRSKSSAPAYRSLKLTSPILTFLIVVAMIARPILDYYRSHVPQANEISPVILAPLGLFVLVCICAAVAATVYFFYRAMQNINVFAGRQVHAPMTTLLMVIPVANLVATPYIHYATYYGSMALSPAHHASRLGAAALAVGAFVLFLANLVFGAASNSSALFEEPYDAVSLSLVATFAGLAGGILYTRIVSRIFKAQEAHAERIGIIASTGKAQGSVLDGVLDGLRSIAVALLVGAAAFTLVAPAEASAWATSLVQTLHDRLEGSDLSAPPTPP